MTFTGLSQSVLAVISGNAVLERLFFVSVELVLLSGIVVLLSRTGLVRSPRIRSMLWLTVMARAVLGLVLSAPLTVGLIERPLPQAAVGPVPFSAAQSGPRVPATGSLPSSSLSTAPQAPQGLLTPASRTPVAAKARRAIPTGHPVALSIVAGWLLGVCSLTWLAAADRIRLRGVIVRSQPPSSRLRRTFDQEARRLRLRRVPCLCVTGEVESPAIAGVFRPTVLLPDWLSGLNDEAKLTWAVRHELMHWKMGDPAAHSLRLVTQFLFFFHPVVWWIGKRWEESAELACDRALLNSATDATSYAEQLFGMLALIGAQRRRPLASGLYASRSSLSMRITALLGEPLRLPAHLTWRSIVGLGLFALVALGFGAQFAERKAHAQSASTGVTTLDLPARVLHFPADHSLGALQIGEQTVEARGTVNVPAGTSVYLGVSDAAAGDLSALAGLKPNDIQGMSLTNTSVQDGDLSYIQNLTGLQQLELRNTGIGDAGVYYLQNLTNLQRLNLNATQVSDEGLAYLQNMTAMRELVLNRTNVSDAGMPYLANMSQLHYLDLWQAKITDAGLAALRNLTNMTDLGIEDTQITDAGLAYLSGMTQMEDLNVESTNITDAGLQYLQGLGGLRALDLNNTLVTDAGMALLAGLTRLTELSLPLQVSPDGMRRLANLPAYRHLAERLRAKKLDILVCEQGTSRGIPGVQLSLTPAASNEPVFFSGTDGKGAAALYYSDDGAGVRVRAFADSYVTAEAVWDSPLPAQLVVQMTPGSPIGGIVVDAAGKPIPGVSVSVPVLGRHNWDSAENLPHTETTDANGRWICAVAPDDLGDFWVSLDHPDYATTTYEMADLSVAALKNQSQVLTLAPPLVLAGVVVSAEGKPIAGARVAELEPWRGNEMRATSRSALTGADGSFSLSNAKPGKIILKTTAVGFATTATDVQVETVTEPVRIVLLGTRALRGRVVDDKGTPIADVYVSVYGSRVAGDRVGGWGASTDAEGLFKWEEAPDDDQEFHFRKDGYRDIAQNLRPGDTVHTITMSSMKYASGVVTDAQTGTPVSAFYVLQGFRADDTGLTEWMGGELCQDPGGRYSLDGRMLARDVLQICLADNRRFMIGIEAPGYYREASEPIDLRVADGPQEINFKLEKGQPLTGRVLSPDGTPATGAAVIAATPAFPIWFGAESVRGPLEQRVVPTDADGRFSIGPERKPFVIVARTPAGMGLFSSDNYSPGGDLRLQPWGRIEVSSTPAAALGQGIGLGFLVGTPPAVNIVSAESNEDGLLVFDRVVAGTAVGQFLRDRDRAVRIPDLSVEVRSGETKSVQIQTAAEASQASGNQPAGTAYWLAVRADGTLTIHPLPQDR